MTQMRKYVILLVVLVLVASCWPFSKKADKQTPPSKKSGAAGEQIEESTPKPGDIKLIDGVEYIFARNRRYQLNPYEPEYVWVRKDQYSPGFGENVLARDNEEKKELQKERTEMEKRIGKLEEDLKKKGIAPQMAYPSQIGSFPAGMGFVTGVSVIPFNYPSPKMKRRIVVLPVIDQTNYKEENVGELATKRLISRLENTGAIICVDPNTIEPKLALSEPGNMKALNELYGVQAILKGTLSDMYTSTSKVEGKTDRAGETSFAISKMTIDVYNTETGTILKQLSGRNPVFLSRERGDMSSEKAKIKAVDLSIEIIADDLLKAVLMMDWHARVASVENGKIYLNAGRLSGLEKGSVLEVYEPGEQIVDTKTKAPLGNVKGAYKGELEVTELFGVDACAAKLVKGSNLSATDLVYLKQ
jgi:hypothetical protein